MTTEKTFLFVYGTLKKGQCRSSLMSKFKFIGECETTPHYRLVNCGSYPALVPGEQSISGELWEVDSDGISFLDRIEGSPYLYKLLPVTLESHPHTTCRSYIYQRPIVGLPDCGRSWDDSMAG